jgi:hypothetical protein
VNEKNWLANVTQLAQTYGWLTYHTWNSQHSAAGFPDLVLVPPQKGVLFRELKTDTGRLTAAQSRWFAALTAAGADMGVWRPRDLETVNRSLSHGDR